MTEESERKSLANTAAAKNFWVLLPFILVKTHLVGLVCEYAGCVCPTTGSFCFHSDILAPLNGLLKHDQYDSLFQPLLVI